VTRRASTIAAIVALAPVALFAQRGRGVAPPASGQAGAGEDLTGYWVSLVTEDWRWRMVTPIKGDSASVPVNQAAKKIMNDWDPAKDEAAGNQCKAYGAGGVMRIPGRLHITWGNDNTPRFDGGCRQPDTLVSFGDWKRNRNRVFPSRCRRHRVLFAHRHHDYLRSAISHR